MLSGCRFCYHYSNCLVKSGKQGNGGVKSDMRGKGEREGKEGRGKGEREGGEGGRKGDRGQGRWRNRRREVERKGTGEREGGEEGRGMWLRLYAKCGTTTAIHTQHKVCHSFVVARFSLSETIHLLP